MKPRIPSELFRFLRQLKRNNARDWFKANKARYESEVRDPMLALIAELASPLARLAPAVVVDPRPIGGSLLRIHRDVRFSKDKTPYKTHASAYFRHRAGSDIHAPGFYLHLEPGQVFFGAGIWHPDPKTLAAIRSGILDNAELWQRITRSRALRAAGALEGEALKRAPKGVDPEHPLIEDLKRKDFILVGRCSEAQALRPDFSKRFLRFCQGSAPLAEFLARSLALDW